MASLRAAGGFVLLSLVCAALLCVVASAHARSTGSENNMAAAGDMFETMPMPESQTWATLTDALQDEIEHLPLSEEEAMTMLLELHEHMDVSQVLQHEEHQMLFESATPKKPAAKTSTGGAASSPKKSGGKRKPAADRLTAAAHAEKFSRFTSAQGRKYATPQKAAEAFATFKANRAAIVALNDKADPEGTGKNIFRSTGPLADMPKSTFTRIRTNSKNPRGKTKGRAVKLAKRSVKKPSQKEIDDSKKIHSGKSDAKDAKDSKKSSKTDKKAAAPANTGAGKSAGLGAGYGAQMSGKTGGQSGKTGGQSGKTGGQSGKTGGQSGKTGGQSGKTGGQSGKTGGQSGKTGGQSGKTGGQSGKTGGKSGKSGGDSGTSAKKSGKSGGDSGTNAKKSGKTGGDGGKNAKKSGKTGGDGGKNGSKSGKTGGDDKLALKYGSGAISYPSKPLTVDPTGNYIPKIDDQFKLNGMLKPSPQSTLNFEQFKIQSYNSKYGTPTLRPPTYNGPTVTPQAVREVRGMTADTDAFRRGGVNMTRTSLTPTGYNDQKVISMTMDANGILRRANNTDYTKASFNWGSQEGATPFIREARRMITLYGSRSLKEIDDLFNNELTRDTALATTSSLDQVGNCGSCWAFVTRDSLQFIYEIIGGPARGMQFSPQQLIDCVRTEDTTGCAGGSPMDALDWWYKNYVATVQEYPITGTQGTCKKGKFQEGTYRTGPLQPFLASYGWMMVAPPCTDATGNCFDQITYEIDLLHYIRAHNTIPIVYVDATNFQHYTGGLFNPDMCKSTMEAGNHIMQLIGYNWDKKLGPTWFLKNTWGPTWGENGRITLPFGRNACGLMNYVIQAVNPVYDKITDIEKERHISGQQVLDRLRGITNTDVQRDKSMTADQLAAKLGIANKNPTPEQQLQNAQNSQASNAQKQPVAGAFSMTINNPKSSVPNIHTQPIIANAQSSGTGATVNFASSVIKRSSTNAAVLQPQGAPQPKPQPQSQPQPQPQPQPQAQSSSAASGEKSYTAQEMYEKLVAQGLIKPKTAAVTPAPQPVQPAPQPAASGEQKSYTADEMYQKLVAQGLIKPKSL